MIELDVVQGSEEWIEARLGIITASEFKKVVTATGKLSKTRTRYLGELLAEWLLGYSVNEFDNDWTERGRLLEDDAFKYYGLYTREKPRKAGFCYKDEGRMIGGSPDALVGKDGVLELKCPGEGMHLVYLVQGELPSEYSSQCQGLLWVTGRKWLDFMSYHPELPPFIIRVEPDEDYHAALDKHMPVFIKEIEQYRVKLREEHGVVPWNAVEYHEAV